MSFEEESDADGEFELDLDSSIKPMENDDDIPPVVDDGLDSDSDSSTDNNSDNETESDKSVDAYELQDNKNNEAMSQAPAPSRTAKKGNRKLPTPSSSAAATTSSTSTVPHPRRVASRKRTPGFAKNGRALSGSTTDLSPADKIIYDMKVAGHGDVHIAGLLRERSLAKYDPKTISTRFRRMREARMRANDVELRTRRRRWTHAEDDALKSAYQHALQRQEVEIARVRKRLFQNVAFRVAETLPGAYYSPEACEERYGDLNKGTAVTESDWGRPEVAVAEGRTRLAAVWEADLERMENEGQEFEDGIVKDLVEGERARRAEERERRGGTIRQVQAERGWKGRGEPKGSKNKSGGKGRQG